MDSRRDQHQGASGGDRPPRRIRVQQPARGDVPGGGAARPRGASDRAGVPDVYSAYRPARGAAAPSANSGAVRAAAAASPPADAGAAGRQAASKRKYFLIGGGALAALVCVLLIAFSQSGAKCPGAVKLKGPKSGSPVTDAFTLGVSVENRRCISAVTYQIDGEDIATETRFPYEVQLHGPTIARRLPKQDTHEVSVTVEDTRGETHTLEERLTLTFAAGPSAEPSPGVSPERAAPAAAPADPAAQPAPAVGARHEELSAQCRQLASQISGKSGYTFAPEFTSLVEQRLSLYRGVPASELARRYRYEVNKAFGDQGVPLMFGYVLAFSRSRFDVNADDLGVGLWQIPPKLARSSNYLTQGESDASLKDPKRSAEIAALYMKDLLNSFDPEDFMYAVACFGMGVNEAGQVSYKLNEVAPDPASRRDIVKMSKAGVLSPAQVDRVARFFAAGIVGEHPQSANRRDAQPFSSLY